MSEATRQHECEWQAKAVEQDRVIAELKDKVEALERRLFGKKSEKMPRPEHELKRRGELPTIDPEALTKKRADGRKWKEDLPDA